MYNYTKPRRPITAMYASPGPSYGLPGLIGQKFPHDPRSVHNRGPAYTFGSRHEKSEKDSSPGPAFDPINKAYHEGLLGRANSPRVSMTFRQKSAPPLKTPGPAAYAPEKCGQQSYIRVPAYTMGTKSKPREKQKTPGPNAYNADSMFGKTVRAGKVQAPAYTMVGKNTFGTHGHNETPGPGNYKATHLSAYKTNSAAYSIVGKNYPPGASMKIPGPGCYHTENVYVTRRSPPKFTFGLRHSNYETLLIAD